jgi:hypothetical protein
MDNFQYSPPKNIPKSSEELINDLQLVSKNLKVEKLSQKLYTEHGKYDCSTYIRRFGSWNKALIIAGLKLSNIINYSDEDLFENILNLWQKKGAQPARRDMDLVDSGISSGAYRRRFSSWTSAINEFIEYANTKEISSIKSKITQRSASKNSRDPSLRLRFQVLKRDNFSCVKCGASPAKDQNIVLNIDHIKPWSKGGITEISNLQTLCQGCNLGKSNIE